MKYSLTLATLLLAISCGKAGKIVEVPGQGMTAQPANPVVEQQVKPYSGERLSINTSGVASLNLSGIEAQKIYEVLQVSELAWSDGVTTAKTGKFIYCHKLVNENKTDFKCTINLDTKTRLLKDNGLIVEDKSAKHMDEDFTSPLLEINQADGYITVLIDGEDAMELYNSSSEIPRVVLNTELGKVISTKGTSPNLRCIQTKSFDEKKNNVFSYSCDLVINSLGWVATLKKK